MHIFTVGKKKKNSIHFETMASAPKLAQSAHKTSGPTFQQENHTPEQETSSLALKENIKNLDQCIVNGDRRKQASKVDHDKNSPDPVSTRPQRDNSYLDSLRLLSSEDHNGILKQQLQKENEGKRKHQFRPKSIAFTNGGCALDDESQLDGAAMLIQRTYRGYKTRREISELGLDASAATKWAHLVKEARWRQATQPKAKNTTELGASKRNETEEKSPQRNPVAREKWKFATTVAKRAGTDQDSPPSMPLSHSMSNVSDWNSLLESSKSSTPSKNRATSDFSQARNEICHKRYAVSRERRQNETKTMGLQYFLEMVDLKHRYGSNLRIYHAEWTKSNTQQNFFYWLDYGKGKNLDLEACPRERLDRELVRYLTREERGFYLVQVDSKGRLCWAKNGERITTSEEYRDSREGIVKKDSKVPVWRSVYAPDGEERLPASVKMNDKGLSERESERLDNQCSDINQGTDAAVSTTLSSSSFSSSTTSDSSLEQDLADKYANPRLPSAFKNPVQLARNLSAGAIFNKLLRKSVRKNTWIFVADTSFRLYVGIKNSGAFQHSSFLQGGRITSAGLIKIKNGRLRSLSPLSGHYRPPARNFAAFEKSLRERGVDMKMVSVNKAYAVLIGLEAYLTSKKRVTQAVKSVGKKGRKVIDPKMIEEMERAEMDGSQSAKKEREVLAKEERRREEEKSKKKVTRKSRREDKE